MARVLDIWRSWSVRRRLAVAGGAAIAVAGLALAVYLTTKRPGDVSNPDAAFTQQKPAGDQDGGLAALRPRPRAHPLPAGQEPEPALRLLGVELSGGQAARVPADRGQGPDLLHGQGRDVLRAQHRQGQGRVEAQDRVAERVRARLLRRSAVRRQPRAAPGGRASPEAARKRRAVAPSAAGAQRVLAARPPRQGDPRLRVGGHLRPRREDRQDPSGRCRRPAR